MKFTNQTFTRDVTLDFNEFINCHIENCTVFYHGGDFKLVNTKLTNVRIGVSGSANHTLAFLKMVRATNPKLVDELLDNHGVEANSDAKPVIN